MGGVPRRASMERRLAFNAALAAAMTGALLALGTSAFAALAGHAPPAGLLAAIVGGAALVCALASRVALAFVPSVRRALGLAPRRPGGR